jgi:16S rRNA (uracil1498-N3)-methyltransferase
MHRFFVSPDQLEGDKVTIAGPAVHHIRDVLRLRPGASIVVLDNSGWERETEIFEVGREQVVGRVINRALATGEPRTKVSLFQGVLKSNHFELVLQKGTELGIVEFVPLISQRCVIAGLDDVNKKMVRWRRIVQEAAEQSQRGRLPNLQPAMIFSRACERAKRAGGLSLMPWEEEERVNLKLVFGKEQQRKSKGKRALSFPSNPFSINLFIGPEGGFTFEEVTLAQHYGIISITLGPRILRAETAGLVAAAAILYELGDLS